MARELNRVTDRRRRTTGDVNGLLLVLVLLATLTIALPCPMSAASNAVVEAGADTSPISATRR